MAPTAAPARKKTASRKPAARKKTPTRKKPPTRKPAPRKLAKRATAARKPPARPALTWRRRVLVAIFLVGAVGAGYMLWLRDSSLVAVTDVEVVGVTTSEREEIVPALTAAAKEMTTLHPDADRLREIAARFPTISSIDVDPNFPHGMRIEVHERPPRMIADASGEQTPVGADGTVLTGVEVPKDQNLPVLELRELPAERLTGEPLEQAVIVGATPDPLLGLVEKVGYSREFGVELTMRGGIALRFGTAERADDKWAAAAAVLADPKLDVACYVDVRIPERAAAGCAA